MKGNGGVALVTGASSGIGRATAAGLVKAGCKVWGTSRQVGAAQGQADVVAGVVVEAALATHPKLRYAPGQAARLSLLRRSVPARLLDAGVRKDLGLQA